MAVKFKSGQVSEIRDPQIAREVVVQIRRERTPEERAAIEARSRERAEFLKKAMDKSFVVVPETDYTAMLKAKRNAEYLAKIDKAILDIKEGRGIVKTMEELETMAHD